MISTGKLVEILLLILNNFVATDIEGFFDAFAHDPKFALHLPVLWTVSIDGVDAGGINSVLSFAGEKWQAKTSPNDMTKGGNILVAQGVSLPTESSEFDAMAMNNNGGFLPGYALTSRTNFLSRNFSVNFIETQGDIEHNFFRPWMIAIGIKGLIAQGVNLKGTMVVKQYTNGGSLLKGFKFNKVFPTAVEGFSLTYDNTDFLIKSVTFSCENYEQL